MKNVQVIERTAKRFKALGLLSKVLVFGSIVLMLFNLQPVRLFVPLVILAFIAGLVLALYTRVAVWWNHG
ncbi:hypothetical protein F3J20_01750 [Paraburkholderia sp. Cy-641]|uniref:hypothetical protein n=1 Tax=Paraburkholderia sp. Cy-641 TaxID=2608337 RepID=UPI00141DE986|nr:hypothetical protein [Paraburkholderia sp. Cy-641]NIF76129.1 hypothetical protein [Paraburkholderia sp. Cy-641]